jgi:EAL domain-containing protein (putative c-di-GMP-specific phosphodiesterase class I)/GGDEF domain-containing protein
MSMTEPNRARPLNDISDASLLIEGAQAALDIALQAITDIHTGESHGFESLLRNTSALGFGSISEFFDRACDLSVLAPADELIFGKAARKLGAAGHSDVLLFLNLDRRHFGALNRTLPILVRTLAAKGRLPQDVCLEISEVGAVSSNDEIVTAAAHLRAHGFRLAIDDFGTGVSGLKSLYQCQLDYIKIDRFFISNLEREGRKRLFVSRVVELAHSLGIKVVAEGVEREEELHACRDAGCDLVQGYLVARPTAETSELLKVYPVVAANSDQRTTPRARVTLAGEGIVSMVEPLVDSTPLNSVIDYFLANPDANFLPVVDARNMPLGIVHERELRSLIQMPFGRDLLQNPSCQLRLRTFVVPLPIFDCDTCTSELIKKAAHVMQDGIIVTRHMKYAGMVSADALLDIAAKLCLREARGQNPLTGLPANDAILDFIDAACDNVDARRAFCYLDFNNFKPFNDKYGFHLGDRALILFADLLRSTFSSADVFVGHIGGDDFFLGASDPALDIVKVLGEVQSQFACDAESFFSAADRERRCFEARARDGTLQLFPLLSCSVALLQLDPGVQRVKVSEISAMLALLKSHAKSSPSSWATRSITKCNFQAA